MKPALRRVMNEAGSRPRSRSAAMMEGGLACARVCGIVRVCSGRVKLCTAAAARWRGDGARWPGPRRACCRCLCAQVCAFVRLRVSLRGHRAPRHGRGRGGAGARARAGRRAAAAAVLRNADVTRMAPLHTPIMYYKWSRRPRPDASAAAAVVRALSRGAPSL
jgi:hypothetical protein